MTPNEKHNLIAETKFKPIVEALLEGKDVQFRWANRKDWLPLDLYSLVANNLSDAEFRILNSKLLIKELFNLVPVITLFYSNISEEEAIKNRNINLFSQSDINQLNTTYFVPVNPFNLVPIKSINDYFKHGE